jgi:hypothetical protein
MNQASSSLRRLDDLPWGEGALKDEHLVIKESLPQIPWFILHAMREYENATAFLKALRDLKIYSCRKAHEKKGATFGPGNCNTRDGNVSCAHWSNQWDVLNIALESAYALKLLDLPQYDHRKLALLDLQELMKILDGSARLFYRKPPVGRVFDASPADDHSSRLPSVHKIHTDEEISEMELLIGKMRLQIGRELLVVLSFHYKLPTPQLNALWSEPEPMSWQIDPSGAAQLGNDSALLRSQLNEDTASVKASFQNVGEFLFELIPTKEALTVIRAGIAFTWDLRLIDENTFQSLHALIEDLGPCMDFSDDFLLLNNCLDMLAKKLYDLLLSFEENSIPAIPTDPFPELEPLRGTVIEWPELPELHKKIKDLMNHCLYETLMSPVHN